MRYGVLADIHGNVQALRATLRELERRGVDGYLVAGDLVGYGPNPNECVEIVAGLDAVCVAGNHDLIATGRLSDERCIELGRQSLRWTREILSEDARTFLLSLPLEALAPGGVVVSHGAIGDPQDYTNTPKRALAQLASIETRAGAEMLVLGHTHHPWAFGIRSGSLGTRRLVDLPPADPLLLNPGSVGQPRELRSRARSLLLDLDRRNAEFLTLPYDARACREALRSAGLPARSCHLRPSFHSAGAHALRRAVRAAASSGQRPG